MSDEENEIEMELSANDTSTELTLTLKSKSAIDFSDLILALESYLTDLTRAEAQKREPGFRTH